jgi:peptidoglycan/LPS O-acetylase OafA/YrhL
MKIGQSLYLDLLRMLMALEVVIGHATFHGYTGHGFLWRIDPFRHLQTAVVAFFVLSGFVIAYVAKMKETDATSYTVARIARMTSIIGPALVITFLADYIGQEINPGFYRTSDFPTKIEGDQVIAYLLNFFYLGSVWVVPNLTPGTNGPFWTMSYEVMYYAMFGVALFAKGMGRTLFLFLLAVLAGPDILKYLPIWLMGVVAYHMQSRISIKTTASTVIFVSSLVLAVALSTYGPEIKSLFGGSLLLNYGIGLCFAANIFAAAGIDKFLSQALCRYKGTVRWLGFLTFSMYLVHRPLLNLFSVIKIGEPDTALQRIWLFGCTFSLIILVAYIGEWLRSVIRRKLNAISMFQHHIHLPDR